MLKKVKIKTFTEPLTNAKTSSKSEILKYVTLYNKLHTEKIDVDEIVEEIVVKEIEL